jgi:Malectin domain
VLKIQVFVTDRIATIQFVPIVNDPFISAIEVVEVPNATAPITIPTEFPISVPNPSPPSATSTEVLRINAGGETFVDSSGNTWANDTFFLGNSFVGDEACTSDRDIVNTTDDALFCSERYFKGNKTIGSSYEIPVNYPAEYQVHLYFSENVSQFIARCFVACFV